MTPDPRRAREQLALDALLGRHAERERSRTELESEPGGAAELRELAEQLARARARLRGAARLAPAQEASFVARVLARTTRQEHRRGGPARESLLLRASPALRWAAAVLLLSLAATAVLAHRFLRAAPGAPALAARLASAASAEGGPRDASWRAEHADALARERSVLRQRAAHAPAIQLAADAPPELRLLVSRASGLRALGDAQAEPAPEPLPEELGALGLALWTELQLDRLALGSEPAAGFDDACVRLERFASDPALAVRAGGTAALVRAALGRAVGLGLVEGPGPESAPALLEPEWFAALERAGRENGFGGRVPVGQLARPER